MNQQQFFRHCFRMSNGILIELKVRAATAEISWTRAIARLGTLGFRITDLTHLPA